MKYLSIRTNKIAALIFTCLITTKPLAFQDFTPEDYTTIQYWVNKAGFETYAAISPGTSFPDLPLHVLQALQALHTTQTQLFYLYLAQLIINNAQQDNPTLSLLVKSEFDLNKIQHRVFERFIIEKNETALANWLHQYISFEKHLKKNKDFYSKFFLILTKEVVSDIRFCPETSILESVKSSKEKRRNIFQCMAKAANTSFIDIDVSRNRVITSRVLSPEPLSLDIALPPPVSIDNGEHHIVDLLDLFNTPDLHPVILLNSQIGKGFIAPLKEKTDSKPIDTHKSLSNKNKRNTDSKQPKPDSKKGSSYKKDERLASLKSGNPYWLEYLIKSPGYSIVIWAGLGALTIVFLIYGPYTSTLYQ